jgi:galactose-1-phosphate uridylyltransferase
VPAHTKEMLNCARTYHEVNGCCCYCAMAKALRQPSRDRERPSGSELVVYSNEVFVAFCPWAPPCDYALYIMPWSHTADLLLDIADGKTIDGKAAGQHTLAALADCLRMAARKLYVFCGNPNYNLVVSAPPADATRRMRPHLSASLTAPPRPRAWRR